MGNTPYLKPKDKRKTKKCYLPFISQKANSVIYKRVSNRKMDQKYE